MLGSGPDSSRKLPGHVSKRQAAKERMVPQHGLLAPPRTCSELPKTAVASFLIEMWNVGESLKSRRNTGRPMVLSEVFSSKVSLVALLITLFQTYSTVSGVPHEEFTHQLKSRSATNTRPGPEHTIATAHEDLSNSGVRVWFV